MLTSNRFFHALLVGLICFSFSDVASAQKIPFRLKLDSDLVSSFKSYGSLRSPVQEQYRGNIRYVELQYNESKDKEPIELDLGIQINGDNANIVLDDDSIRKVMGQPVRVPVSESAEIFKQIVLMYDAPVAAAPPALNDGGAAANMHYIRLGNDKVMSGSIDGFEQFEIATRFGKVSMPMDQVAGIKFHTDGSDSCVVVLNNGDTVTGVPVIPAIKLKTDWGQADIEPAFIDALTTTSAAKFVQDNSDFGVRWKLKTGESLAPRAPTFN